MNRHLILFLAASGLMYAQGPNQGTGAPEIIPHRTNPQGAGAPTAGSTGAIKPAIQYHGGSVMNMPTPYLISYGNWNQTNGSDNPTGQQIVRDAIFGLSGSNYYVTNASYTAVSGLLNVFRARERRQRESRD